VKVQGLYIMSLTVFPMCLFYNVLHV